MTETTATPDLAQPAPTTLWVERTGTRTYTGRSSRGAEVLIGPAEAGAVFTPGELLKIALAGCTGMSADHALSRRLGADVPVTVHVSGQADRENEYYPALAEELVVDMSSLDETQRARLLAVVQRAVAQVCTVGRTLARSTPIDLVINPGPTAERVTGRIAGPDSGSVSGSTAGSVAGPDSGSVTGPDSRNEE